MKGRQFSDYSFSSAASNSSLIRSHQRCSMKKGVLRNVTRFTGKHLCQSLFFNKVADLRPATLLKKRLWHRRFPVSFMKFLRTPFLQNTSGWLFLIDNPRMCWFCRECLSPNHLSLLKSRPFLILPVVFFVSSPWSRLIVFRTIWLLSLYPWFCFWILLVRCLL